MAAYYSSTVNQTANQAEIYINMNILINER